MKPWVGSQSMSFYEYWHKVIQVSSMLALPYTKGDVGLLEACLLLVLLGKLDAKLALRSPFPFLGQWVHCAYPIFDPKVLSNFERWTKEVPKFLPSLKIDSNTQKANELWIKEYIYQTRMKLIVLFLFLREFTNYCDVYHFNCKFRKSSPNCLPIAKKTIGTNTKLIIGL